MNYLNAPITDPEMLMLNHVFREGFSFTSTRKPAKVFNALVIRNPSNCVCESPSVGFSTRTLDEHIALINRYHLERAIVIADDIHFLQECPSIKFLDVIPATIATPDFDYSPLYHMPNLISLCCETHVGDPCGREYTTIDYAYLPKLQELCATGKGHRNLQALSSLKSLQLNNVAERNLSNLIGSKCLSSLTLLQCGIRSLEGIEIAEQLSSLSLFYCRSLQDMDQLRKQSDHLTYLAIENCPKTQDFSWLNVMHKLQYLKLYGRNTLPNLSFLQTMPDLNTFTFSMEILDGDLSGCLKIPYVYCDRNRKYYNLKDADLPKHFIPYENEVTFD